MFLLETVAGYKLLIDCGMDVDRRRLMMEEVLPPLFSFDPATIDAVLLTHAHIDHSGNLPALVRAGFEGTIFSTQATYELTQFLLLDSASLNKRKLAALNKDRRGGKRKAPPGLQNKDDFYLEKDVDDTLDCFRTVQYNRPFRLFDGVEVTFNLAGHLLGAANIIFKLTEGEETKTICFSGDVGRPSYPLLQDPIPPPQVDYLVMESTYGGRRHTEKRGYEEVIRDVIYRTCVEKPGRLLIPAFAVGRSQTILHIINQIYKQAELPPVRVFVDSPLAIQSTRVYDRFVGEMNAKAKAFANQNDELFDFDSLTYVADIKASRAISNYKEPCVIISSAGMMEGGRIQQHVSANIGNPLCTIFMVGYMAEGTLGHRLLTGATDMLTIDRKEVPIRAGIEKTDIFSGHAGHDDLLAFAHTQDPKVLKGIFLVHGELSSMTALAEALEADGYNNVRCPRRGDSIEL
jgi:metallo-beta-lactamase family protein